MKLFNSRPEIEIMAYLLCLTHKLKTLTVTPTRVMATTGLFREMSSQTRFDPLPLKQTSWRAIRRLAPSSSCNYKITGLCVVNAHFEQKVRAFSNQRHHITLAGRQRLKWSRLSFFLNISFGEWFWMKKTERILHLTYTGTSSTNRSGSFLVCWWVRYVKNINRRCLPLSIFLSSFPFALESQSVYFYAWVTSRIRPRRNGSGVEFLSINRKENKISLKFL